MSGPLSHIKVLDLSRIMAGPWTTQIFADLGADVIKVERPKVGDDTRSWGPPWLKDEEGNPTREAGYYLSVNRGKRSVTVSLNEPEGQELIRELAKECDVVMENFKVGGLKKFGLDYESLKKINPKIIYCSITGFGQTGPKKDLAAYDFAIQGMGGLMSVTGEKDGKPGGGPQKVGVPIVDLTTGMYAAVAVLAAIAHRDETGEGDYIDIGMLDVVSAMLCNQAMNYLTSGRVPKRNGNAHPNIQPQDVFPCRDGDMVLACGNDGQFVKLCQVLGKLELAEDERFIKNSGRVENNAVLTPILREAFMTNDRAYWVDQLESAGVPCGPINTVNEVLEEEQIKHRKMQIELPHPSAGKVPLMASPMNFTNAPIKHERHPPMLGEHTEEVLNEIGLTEEQIAALKANNII